MTLKIYSILDKVTGIFGDPFCAINLAQAVRRFDYLMKNSPMVSKDCALYLLGEFDTVTGTIPSTTCCEFIKNYDNEE